MSKKLLFYGLSLCLLSSFGLLTGHEFNKNQTSLDNEDFSISLDKTGRRKQSKYDYIIVGLGNTGAVLARNLSNPTEHHHSSSHSRARSHYKNSVLVLEAGPNFDNDPIVNDPDAFGNTVNAGILNAPPYSFVYPALVNGGPSAINVTGGLAWGGTSIHNFMTAVRGTPYIYDNWATLSGNKSWAYNNLLPTIRAVETYTPNGTVANYTQRGNNGLSSVIQFTPPITDPFLINIATVGPTAVGLRQDFNDPTQGTVGYSARQVFNTPFGPTRRRSFSSKDYIDPVVDANGNGLDGRRLKIESTAVVSRVLFRGKTAIGVEYFFKSNPANLLKAYGRKIILSAGTFNTTPILERSGIGDPAILEPLGIKVLVNNPNVGSNLQVHYNIAPRMSGPVIQFAVTGHTDLRGQGGYPADGIRRFQMNITNAGILPPNPALLGQVQFQGVIMNPKSRGFTHIVSTNPLTPPRVNLGAYSDAPVGVFGSDANMVVSYLRWVKQLADQNGRTMIAPTPATYATDAQLLQFAVSNLSFQAHYVGTTRMAKKASQGVVDGKLRVFGVKNLMVADIGIEPLITDGNTAYGAYVIGMELSRLLGAEIPNLR
jgi:choline dehydrogenase